MEIFNMMPYIIPNLMMGCNNMAQTRLKTWEISDEFWGKIEERIPANPRLPDKEYRRKPGGGKKSRYSNRLYFSAIIYVLRTGIIWNALPRLQFDNITSQAVHKKFMQWSRAGFFQRLWRAGLMEYDEMEGIAWEWQSVDGSMSKAPLALESVGANPTDRKKKRKQKTPSRGRAWRPVVNRRNRRKQT
jgi:transposase